MKRNSKCMYSDMKICLVGTYVFHYQHTVMVISSTFNSIVIKRTTIPFFNLIRKIRHCDNTVYREEGNYSNRTYRDMKIW